MLAAARIAAVLWYARLGRRGFAIDTHEEMARMCGVRVERTKLLLDTLGVGRAGLTSMLQLRFLNMVDPTTTQGLELV